MLKFLDYMVFLYNYISYSIGIFIELFPQQIAYSDKSGFVREEE